MLAHPEREPARLAWTELQRFVARDDFRARLRRADAVPEAVRDRVRSALDGPEVARAHTATEDLRQWLLSQTAPPAAPAPQPARPKPEPEEPLSLGPAVSVRAPPRELARKLGSVCLTDAGGWAEPHVEDLKELAWLITDGRCKVCVVGCDATEEAAAAAAAAVCRGFLAHGVSPRLVRSRCALLASGKPPCVRLQVMHEFKSAALAFAQGVELSEEGRGALRRAAQIAASNRLRVLVVGHAEAGEAGRSQQDVRPSTQDLARRRADAAAELLRAADGVQVAVCQQDVETEPGRHIELLAY